MSSPFLTFENISKSYGSHRVLKDIQLDVNQGEIFSLLGPSGCGKTTLLRICAGFETPDSGRVLLEGKDITDLPPNERPVNTVFQSYALFPHLSIRDNIGFGLKLAGHGHTHIREETDRMLAFIQMESHADKMPDQISGGQKQRVAIARGLVNKPRVLLLDEPLAALDLKLRQRMLVELDAMHDEVGITFIYVTHDQGEAMAISDRLTVMNAGVLEQIGKPVEIYEAPKSSFVAAFIGDTNFVDGEITAKLDGQYIRLTVEDLGTFVTFNDMDLPLGTKVNLSLRPEKIELHPSCPEPRPLYNVLEGTIEDVIYFGSNTKYWIRSGEWRFAVDQPHRRYQLDTRAPTWGDTVWVAWHGDDGFMLEQYRAADEELLALPDDGAS